MPAKAKPAPSPKVIKGPTSPKSAKKKLAVQDSLVQESGVLQDLVSKVKDEYNNIPHFQRVLQAEKDEARRQDGDPSVLKTPKTPLGAKTPTRRIYTRQGYAGGSDDPNCQSAVQAVDHRPYRSQDLLNFEDTVIKDLQKHLRLSQASRPKTGPGSRNGSKYNSDEDDEDDDDENIPDETPTASFARDMNLSEEEDEDDAPSVTEEVKKSRAKWLESIDDVCIYGNDSRASTDESDADIEEQLDTVEVPDLDSHFVNLSSSPPGPTVPPPSPTNKPVRGGVGTNKAPASTIRRSRYSEVIRRSREQRTTGIQSSPRNGKALFGRSPRSISPGRRR